MKRIVIYGAEMSGVCAAFKAASYFANNNLSSDNYRISLIIPYPNKKLGGLATVGGLNMWDASVPQIKDNNNQPYYSDYVQGGTFKYLLNVGASWNSKSNYPNKGQWYKTIMEYSSDTSSNNKDMGDFLTNMVVSSNPPTAAHNYIDLLPMMDIVDIDYELIQSKKVVRGLYLRNIKRDPNGDGYIRWGRTTKYIAGDIFIDASDDGKMTSFLTPVTTGRYDWPTVLQNNQNIRILEPCEENNYHVGRQQSASLYFRLNGVNSIEDYSNAYKDVPNFGFYYGDSSGAGAYGEVFWDNFPNKKNSTFNSPDSNVYKYNVNHYTNDPYMIKEYNFARNGMCSDEFWANTMLMFNVDGRAHYRDIISKFYPKAMISDNIDRDKAWVKCRNIISEDDNNSNNQHVSFIEGIQGFNISNNASIVRNPSPDNRPKVADIMYIRETVHLPCATNSIDNDSENINYAIKKDESFDASNGYQNNEHLMHDNQNYSTRIGLGYYGVDIHPYVKDNYFSKNNEDNYYDIRNSLEESRPDVNKNDFSLCPTYIPFEVMCSNNLANVLVAGNASSISSFSWGEMRVLPNLCVIGDAAGVSAAYILHNNIGKITDVLDVIDGYENRMPLNYIQQYLGEHAGAILQKYDDGEFEMPQ